MTAMMMKNISKSYGEKVILNDVSLQIDTGNRIGLIGANGSGKSTLFRILTGYLAPDSGQIHISKGATVGYLPQTLPHTNEDTVGRWIRDAQKELKALEHRIRALTEQMAVLSGSELEAALSAYGDVVALYESKDGYNLEHNTNRVLRGLGIDYLDLQRRVQSLSGGEKTRLGLAALLIQSPDLLLLDEPTNHLDSATLQWLESYLAAYRGTLIVISHDRKFLNQTVTKIAELDEYQHTLVEFPGNYDAYVIHKQQLRQRWEEQYEAEQKEVAELKQRLSETARQVGHNRPMKDGNKMAYYGHGQKVQQVVSRNLKAAQVQLDRILEHPTPRPPEPMEFSPAFDPAKVHHPLAISVSGLNITTPSGQAILKEVTFSLGRTEHMLITGANGAGKTTLLNLLAGKQATVSGEVFIPQHVKIGYIEQEFHYQNEGLTVLEWFARGLPGERKEHIAKLLSYQLFQFAEFQLPVRGLSPGQYRKLMLAKLMAEKPHLLLIDEPTNHISFDILAEFERALRKFPGPVIVVSHDRWFIEHFEGTIWTLTEGELVPTTSSPLTSEEQRRMINEVNELSQYSIE